MILENHFVDGGFLWHDDFKGFLRARASKLLDVIEEAMGESVSGRDTDETIAAFGAPLLP
jgi:hypothetical protein